jgi:hypothetical protein
MPGIDQCLHAGQTRDDRLARQRRLEDDRTIGLPRHATLEITGTKRAPNSFPRERYQHAGQRWGFQKRCSEYQAARDPLRDQVLDEDDLERRLGSLLEIKIIDDSQDVRQLGQIRWRSTRTDVDPDFPDATSLSHHSVSVQPTEIPC